MADQANFERDVLQYLPSLKGAAMKATRNPSDAEDLIQETLFRAYRRYDSFEEGTNLRAWLHRILINTYINGYRQKQRRVIESPLDGGNELLDYDQPDRVTPSVESQVIELHSEINKDDITRALCALPDKFLIPMLLIDGEALSYLEASEILGIPIGTVMSRLHRGRLRLQKAMLELAQDRGLIAA